MLMGRSQTVEKTMPDSEFLERLRNSQVGREVITAREQTVAEKRRAAADNVAAAYASEAETLRRIDADLAREQKEINSLATKLQAGQERHGALAKERVQAQNSRLQIVRRGLAYLQGTCPGELLELAQLVHDAEWSARFQIGLRPSAAIPIGVDPNLIDQDRKNARAAFEINHKLAAALLTRAREVGSQIQQLLASPNVDLETVARLRVYLDAPAELTRGSGITWTEPRR